MADGKIIIGADLVPTLSNINAFISGNAEELVGKEIKQILDSADFRIFNLETPLCDELSPIEKCGPNLSAPTDSINGYKALKADLLTIANNHVLDQGENGFKSTIDTIDMAGIKRIGGGFNREEVTKPVFFEVASKKIGVYACCDREFSLYSDNGYGANGFDALETMDEIKAVSENCDYLIVLYHGGKEHYRYPAPYLVKICRKMVDKGANLVLCQHTHCIGAEEDYKNGKILYGQGNFLFDHSKSDFWKTALLVSVDVKNNFKVEYYPLEKNEASVKLSHNENILKDFYLRSEEIKDFENVKKRYDVVAKESEDWYLKVLKGFYDDRLFRFLNKISKGKNAKTLLKQKSRDALLDYFYCDAHRDTIIRILEMNRKNSDKNNL